MPIAVDVHRVEAVLKLTEKHLLPVAPLGGDLSRFLADDRNGRDM